MLLQAAYAAEFKVEKGWAAHSKAANMVVSHDKVNIKSRDPSPMAASVAAIELKLDKSLKAVWKVAQAPVAKNSNPRQGNYGRE